jgi:hypothetical protein
MGKAATGSTSIPVPGATLMSGIRQLGASEKIVSIVHHSLRHLRDQEPEGFECNLLAIY